LDPMTSSEAEDWSSPPTSPYPPPAQYTVPVQPQYPPPAYLDDSGHDGDDPLDDSGHDGDDDDEPQVLPPWKAAPKAKAKKAKKTAKKSTNNADKKKAKKAKKATKPTSMKKFMKKA
jgi:hypothetical protein